MRHKAKTPPPARRPRPRAADRRFEILEKAAEVFKRYGVKKATMEDIGSACGLGGAALYHYFASKEEILAEVIRWKTEETLASLESIANAESDARSKLLALMSRRNDVVRQTIIDNALASVMMEIWPLVAQAAEHFLRLEQELFTRILEQGQREGAFKPFNAQVVARVLLAALGGMAPFAPELLVFRKHDADVHQLAELLCDGLRA